MENDFKVILEAMIDNSSLSNVQKQLAKERLKISADITVEDFAKSKNEIKNQIEILGREIETILGDAVSSKEANRWAKEYYDQMIKGAKEAEKAQQKLNNAQAQKNLATQEKYYKKIIDNNKSIYSLKNKLLSADEKQTQEIQEQITKLEKRNQYNYGQLSKRGLTDNSWERAVNDSLDVLNNQHKINSAKKEDVALSKQIAELNKIQLSLGNGDYDVQLKAYATSLQKAGIEGKELETKISGATTALEKLRASATGDDIIPNEVINKATTLDNEFKKLANDVKNINLDNSLFASNINVDQTIIRLNEQLRKNSAYSNDAKKKIKAWIAELERGDVAEARLKEINVQAKQLHTQMGKLNKIGLSFFDKVKQGMESFKSWLSATSIIMGAINAFKTATTNVKALDDSLVELSKVSDLSAEGLENITEEAYELGEQLAKTGTDVLDATTSFKRAGYDIAESMEYAEEALKTTNISENLKDASEAADSLVNIMKGFQNETPEFARKINDSVNQVSNTEAVDFDNLIDGATRLSAVADQAGMSFEQMLGTLTGGYEVLGNMEKVATGQITIFSRLQAIQLDGEEEVSTVANLQKTFSNATKGAVNIVDETTGQLRNVYDILDDINSVWDSLDKNTQEALAIEAAGIRQKNVFLALMQNWQGVEDAVNSAKNSLGSADEENQKYLESLSGKMEDFESATQHLSKTLVDSELLKFFVDFGSEGVRRIDSVASAVLGLTENTKGLSLVVGGIGTTLLQGKGLD